MREILADADWIIWASLDDLLPLLAEASPVEFLDAVEKALKYEPCPFDMLFAQEGNGIMGRNYTTGLLWALETLAWDTNYLTRVIVILGELASRDPGGTWANRPANSLTTILLPWLPQTCAPVLKRQAAVATLLDEFPEVAWTLLLSLLPGSHQSSFGSHKPSWREMIDDNWKRQVNQKEYWEQINAYSELTVNAAKRDVSKLVELIKHLDNLPQPARDQILSYLRSDAIVSMAQTDRLGLWTELVDLVSRHRKYSSARWALKRKRCRCHCRGGRKSYS